jgi:membrane glycosyltransferase
LVWGSRVATGGALRRCGLMLTPEELRQPRVLAEAAREAEAVAARPATFRMAVVEPRQQDGSRRLAARRAHPGWWLPHEARAPEPATHIERIETGAVLVEGL